VTVSLDHLVVVAPTLDEGARWCEAALGIVPGPGGKHPLMGTHNRLFSIAGEAFPMAYFEIIAIDPAAPAPARARWFGMDAAGSFAGPRLVHLVARSGRIDAHCAALRAVGLDPGTLVAASRDTPQGRLEWRISVRDDGRLLCGGALPTLIEWGSAHPVAAMPVSGVRLHALTLGGLPPAAMQALDLAGVSFGDAGAPAITATLDSPRGRVILRSA
jgi:hypothetical protein